MENKNFSTMIQAKASAEEAARKISEVDKWWAKKVTGKTAALNDTFTVDFGQTFVDFRVSELVPGQKIAWKVTDCNLHWINDKKEWKDTEVVFELSEKEHSTQIDFTHIGLAPAAECYDDCKVGWTKHVTVSLLQFINEGVGMPQ